MHGNSYPAITGDSYRYKQVIGPKLSPWYYNEQVAEVPISVKVINKMSRFERRFVRPSSTDKKPRVQARLSKRLYFDIESIIRKLLPK